MKIMAIDPGRTIGYARMELEGTQIELIEIKQQQVGTEVYKEDWNPWGSEPLFQVAVWKPDVLIIEDFVGGGIRSFESSQVLKMIGAFRLQGELASSNVIVQAPGVRSRFLKRGTVWAEQHIDLHIATSTHHGLDAFAHLIHFLYKQDIELEGLTL